MNTQQEIERFIVGELLAGKRQSLDPDEPLTTTGLIDSLGTLRLITFLEERFGVAVGDGDVVEENFGTLNLITETVKRKQNELRGASA